MPFGRVMSNATASVAAVIAAGLVLSWPAAWNAYALVFADSGTYLGQALHGYLGWDRPPHYSLFLHALHWRRSLWPVPLAQGLITAHLLFLTLRVLGRPGPMPLLVMATGLALATALPWLAAQIMPDLFTGLMVLAIWLLGFGWDRLTRLERVYVLTLATGAITLHLSHLPQALALAAVGTLVSRERVRAGLRMAAPILLAALSLAFTNAVGHGRVAVSPFGSVFLAARLLEDGPALRTLDSQCEEAKWNVCELRPRLPMAVNDFLWLPDGPLRGELGGGKAWAGEAGVIVAATLMREPVGVAQEMLSNAVRQFFTFGTGDGLEAWRGEPGPEPLIERWFPRELEAFRTARQQLGLLQRDVATFRPVHLALAWVGLLILPWMAWRRRRDVPALALCVMVLAAAAANALVTGGLSSVSERYQARIAWLFVFVPAALLVAKRRPLAEDSPRPNPAKALIPR